MSQFEDPEETLAGREPDGASVEPGAGSPVADALLDEGIDLAKQGRVDAASQCFDRIVSTFGDATAVGVRKQVAFALANKGYYLFEVARDDEAHAALDELIARFGNQAEPALHKPVALALYYKTYALEQAGERADAIALVDELEARFGTDPRLTLRRSVADGLRVKGTALTGMGLVSEAGVVYDQIVERYAGGSDPELDRSVVLSLYSKAGLADEHDRAGAIAIYDDLRDRFADATEQGSPLARRQRLRSQGLCAGAPGPKARSRRHVPKAARTLHHGGGTRHRPGRRMGASEVCRAHRHSSLPVGPPHSAPHMSKT